MHPTFGSVYGHLDATEATRKAIRNGVNNLAAMHPERVNQMKAVLEESKTKGRSRP